MIKVCITSDSHFFHRNIIKYCNRPFSTMEDMHEHMISEWNSVVGENDIIIHLGDFICGGTFDQVKEIVDRLNGYKILIKGNHDTRSNGWFKRVGFDRVFKHHFCIGEYLFSHIPNEYMMFLMTDADMQIRHNFHGHSHKYQYGKPYLNFGVDVIGYRPVRMKLNLTEDDLKHGESRPINYTDINSKYGELSVNQTDCDNDSQGS